MCAENFARVSDQPARERHSCVCSVQRSSAPGEVCILTENIFTETLKNDIHLHEDPQGLLDLLDAVGRLCCCRRHLFHAEVFSLWLRRHDVSKMLWIE